MTPLQQWLKVHCKDKEGNVVLVDVKYDDIRPYKIIKEDLEQRGFTTIGYEYPGSLTTTPWRIAL